MAAASQAGFSRDARNMSLASKRPLPAVLRCQVPPPRHRQLRPQHPSRRWVSLASTTPHSHEDGDIQATPSQSPTLDATVARLWAATKPGFKGRLEGDDISAAVRTLMKTTWTSSRSHLLLPLLWTLARCRNGAEAELRQAILMAVRSLLSVLNTEHILVSMPARSLVAALEALRESEATTHHELVPRLAAALTHHSMLLDAPYAARALIALSGLQYRPSLLVSSLTARLVDQASCPCSSLQTLTPRLLDRLIHASAVLDAPSSSACVRVIADRCLQLHRALSPATLAKMTWIIARHGDVADKYSLLQRFIPIIETVLPKCTMKELSDVARAYAKADIASAELFDGIAARSAVCIETSGPEDITRVVTSFHQLGLQPEALLDIVEIWADQRLAALTPQALVAAVSSFARLGNASSRLLRTAAMSANATAERMTPSQLTRLAWAFARLEYQPGDFMLSHAVTALQTHSPGSLDDRHVSNGLWALARLEHRVPSAVLGDIAARVLPYATTYSGHSAALTLWAFATLRYHPGRNLVGNLIKAVAANVNALDSQSISLTAWALGTLGQPEVAFTRALEASCSNESRMAAFEPHHLSNLLWGLAKSEADVAELRGLIPVAAHVARTRFHEFGPQQLFNTCWALATLKCSPPGFAAAAASELAMRGSEFNSLELSGMMWALSRLFSYNPRVYHGSSGAYGAMQHANQRFGLPSGGEKLEEHDGGVVPSSASSLNDTARAIDDVLNTANAEVPRKAAMMTESEVSMALHGLCRLIALAAAEAHSIPTATSFDGQAIHALLARLESCVCTLNVASLISVLEALVQLPTRSLKQPYDGRLLTALSERILVLTPLFRSWELAHVTFHLVELDMCDTAAHVVNLSAEHTPLCWRTLAPPRAIELLFAMAQSGACPDTVFKPVKRCLEKLAPTYRLSKRHVWLWRNALVKLAPERAAKVRMNKVWEVQVRPRRALKSHKHAVAPR